MGVTLAPTSPVDPDADPAYKIGNIPVTIQSGALTVYAINPVSGRLTAKGCQRTGKEPICVEIAAL